MLQPLVQLALDLFDPPQPPAAAPQKNKTNTPLALDGQAQAATQIVADGTVKTAPWHTLQAPVAFRHPQASHEVVLGHAVVGYALQRARRRSIGFTVGADGLSVRAPTWVPLAAVDDALREKSGWILRKLGEARERQQRLEHTRILWQNGAVLPYLGAPLQVVLDPAASVAGTLHRAGEAASAAQHLHIGLPAAARPEQIRDAVQAWLMRRARQHFTERLNHFAPQLNVRWSRLRLSSAQTRWGSARADGSISLNWRLLHYPPAVIDYVVVHELAHLRVMDHSPRFWDTVRTVVPDYPTLRRHLHEEPAPLWA